MKLTKIRQLFSHHEYEDDDDDYFYNRRTKIYSWCTQPERGFYFDGDGMKRKMTHEAISEPLFGFEIEVSRSDKRMSERKALRMLRKMTSIVASNSHLMCTRDSSVAGIGPVAQGFEVKSVVGTADFFSKSIDWSYLRKLEKLDAVTKGIGEQGFHIHVDNRAFVDEAHKERFARQISKDVVEWAKDCGWAYVGNYAKLIPDDLEDSDWKFDKYHVVNLRNDRTTEVRCLMPTFDKDRIAQYFEYVNMIINETKGGE
jgi:hypothetical protein